MIDDHLERYDDDLEVDIPEPYWTARRIVYFIIVLITLIAFIAYMLWPLVAQSLPGQGAPSLPEPLLDLA